MTPISKSEFIRRAVFIAFASFFCGIIGVELYGLFSGEVRPFWAKSRTQFDGELGWVPRAGYHEESGKIVVTTNSLGFRSREIEPEKKHVLVLGGSVSWAPGIGNDQTAAHYLETQIEALGYQVHNLSVEGYSLGQTLIYLKRQISNFERIDTVVLVVNTANDVSLNASNVSGGRSKPHFHMVDEKLDLLQGKIKRFNFRHILSNSYFLQGASETNSWLSDFMNGVAGDRALELNQAQRVTWNLINEIRSIAESNGAEFLAVLSPGKGDFVKKTQNLAWFQSLFISADVEYIDMFLAMRAWLKKSKKPRNKHLDEIYRNRNDLLTDYGHKLMGLAIARRLAIEQPQQKRQQQVYGPK